MTSRSNPPFDDARSKGPADGDDRPTETDREAERTLAGPEDGRLTRRLEDLPTSAHLPITDLPTYAADPAAHPSAAALPVAEHPVPITPGIAERYRFQGEHGRGGQARVLVAFDAHVGREVAWKELLPEWSTSAPGGLGTIDAVTLRFLREARITAQLEHPSIVPVHEIGRREDGTSYYTMRLVRGETLAAKLDRSRNLSDRLALLGSFWDLCNAVAFAHDRGVIHRDIKPGNVMVGAFGETVVLDWGLAKVRGGPDLRGKETRRRVEGPGAAGSGALPIDATMAGAALGTPWYMSPEQADGRVEAIDERSDVWGLGAVLYEILTGRPPHDGADAAEVLQRARRRTVRPVRDLCRDAPPELAGIAAKCLARDPTQRYADAGELAADVSAYMTGGRVRAHAYSSWELLRRFAARNKGTIAALAAVFVVVLAALVVVAFAWRGEAEARGREREALRLSEFHLAGAEVRQAERLLDDRRFLSAEIHALSSLLHNPSEPRSPQADPAFVRREPDAARLRVAALSVVYRTRLRHVGALERTLSAPAAVMDIAFSPDGRRVAAVDDGGTLVVWDLPGGRERIRTRSLDGRATVVAFSPDGRRLLCGGPASPARIHLLDGGAEPIAPVDADGVTAALFLPGGERVVTGHADGRLAVRDARTGAVVAEPGRHEAGVWGLAFSPDGRWIASASWDKTAVLWDAGTLEQRAVLAGHTDALTGVAFFPDGRRLASSAYDGAVRLWSVPGGDPAGVLQASTDAVLAVDVSPDGRTVLSGGMDRVLRLWNPDDGTLRMAVEGHGDAVTGAAFSPDGARIASGSQDGLVRLWSFRPDDGLLVLPHPDGAYGVAFSPDGGRIATASWDREVRIWNAATGALLRTLSGHADGAYSVAFSPDGTLVASGAYDGAVRIWHARDGRVVRILEGHRETVPGVAFSPDGRTLASASHDGRPRIWTVDGETPPIVLPDHGGYVYQVSFSPDGRRLATSSFDRRIRIWNTADWTLEREIVGHQDWVTGVAFSADGTRLLSTGKERIGIVWDTAGWRETARLVGHEQWVNRGAFSPDGRLVVTGGDDGFAFAWDPGSGTALLRIDVERPVQDVAISPDGRRFVVAEPRAAVVFPLELPDTTSDLAAALAAARRNAGEAQQPRHAPRPEPP
jgi:WD40 repeat protein